MCGEVDDEFRNQLIAKLECYLDSLKDMGHIPGFQIKDGAFYISLYTPVEYINVTLQFTDKVK